jgi:hypothetical protein
MGCFRKAKDIKEKGPRDGSLYRVLAKSLWDPIT